MQPLKAKDDAYDAICLVITISKSHIVIVILSIYCPALFQMIIRKQDKIINPYSTCADKPLKFLHTGPL